MLGLVGSFALASAAIAQTPAPARDPCANDPSCRKLSAADVFAAADAAVGEGDLASAEDLLAVLTEDPDPELRAEARFRLAAVRERRNDLSGAAEALQALLAEKPEAQRARLELSRILALQGEDRAARRELRRAQAAGLPPDVAVTVRRFSTALNTRKRRGFALDLGMGPDSNVNRATRDRFVDTVIAPFELDPDARSQSGVGLGIGAEAWSRNSLLGTTVLTRAGARGDFFLGKSRFNDIQLALSSGPELETGLGRVRPALTYERRWYGDHAYSKGYGGTFNWMALARESDQVQFDGSLVRQTILRNRFQSGYRYSLAATWDHAFTPETSLRTTLRGASIDARANPESLRQIAADALLIRIIGGATLFAQAGYARTEGIEPFPLFGKTRRDDRFDLGAGVIAGGWQVHGFAPLARLSYTNSSSNLGLYDFRRLRLDLGFTREF